MYALFYNFLIEELLVRFFDRSPVEAGDKYYIVIEDEEQRRAFLAALHASTYTSDRKIVFPGYEKYDAGPSEYDTVAFTSKQSGRAIVVSGCDDAGDGFQTMIRNNVGVPGSVLAPDAALFILPGTNAIETLLSAGRNLEDTSYPLCTDAIVRAIKSKIEHKIHSNEQAYLDCHVETLRADDYTSLFDFAPVLSILQKQNLKGSFAQLEAFEDPEIYDNVFVSGDIRGRVKDNMAAFATISEMMSEAYEQDRYRRLSTYLDPELAKKIAEDGTDAWKKKEYKEICRSHEVVVGNPTLLPPKFSVNGSAQLVTRTIGPKTGKISKSFIIVCDPAGDATVLKAEFNKNLKAEDCPSGVRRSANTASIRLDDKIVKTGIGDKKNCHEIIVLRLPVGDVFGEIKPFFKLKGKDKPIIVVDVPDGFDSMAIGSGENEMVYDDESPVEFTEDMTVRITFEAETETQSAVTFQFGDRSVQMHFKYKGDKIPVLSPASVMDTIWDKPEGGYTYDDNAKEISGMIFGPDGPVYTHERFIRLANLEKFMIDSGKPYLYVAKDDFCDEYRVEAREADVDATILDALGEIFSYFRRKNTVPSFVRPDAELCGLYDRYLEAVHACIGKIPTTAGLCATKAINITRLGVVEHEDGTIMLSPLHPLMVAYGRQMAASVDTEDFNKKVLDELSPLNLMPFIYYGKNTLMAISSTETEGLFTWVKYDKATEATGVYGSKSTSKLITDKIKVFIENFPYYFPDKDCTLRVSAIGLSRSVDLVRGVVHFIDQTRKKGTVQRLEIHEYVDDILTDTFFEKLNRQSSRDNIADLFEKHNFDIAGEDLNEVIRILFSRVSYYKHSFADRRTMTEYSHVTFFKIDSGTKYAPMAADQLRMEMSLDGLVSIPSTQLNGNTYMMGFGTQGMKANDSHIYKMAGDMNSLYAGLAHDGLPMYRHGQCTAKNYEFDAADILPSVYSNSAWVTFVSPEVDIDFFYKQDNMYVVHYVEQHSLSARLESITVTRHVEQYNKMLFNSLQKMKSIKGTSEDFSRKMISYFNTLNGKWLLEITNKPDYVIREKMSLVATCLVMQHFLKRTDDIVWVPVALDEIIRATGAIGMSQDGLFSKKDLGLDGSLSDDLLMIGIRSGAGGDVEMFFYPVEVKVLSNGTVAQGERQVTNLYKNALRDVLFKGESFTKKVYRALFVSHLLSNTEKMLANDLMSRQDYERINSVRFELLNLRFRIAQELPEEIGKAAVMLYSDAAPRSMSTEIVDDVPLCHISMLESDCYRIVSNPDGELLQFVEKQPIMLSTGPASAPVPVVSPVTTAQASAATPPPVAAPEEAAQQAVTPQVSAPAGEDSAWQDDVPHKMEICLGFTTRKGEPVITEPNNPRVMMHPNIGITGTMGTGKTQLVRSIIAQFSRVATDNVGGRPVGMLVFDYKGDYNDDKFIDCVQGTCTFFDFPFNPLKLLKSKKNVMQNLPAITAEAIADSLAKAFGTGPVQRSKIKDVIIETYAEFGITADYQTWDRPAPTINDVIERYLDKYDATDTVYSYFSSLNNYRIFSSRPESCVSIFEWLDRVRVIDLTEINSDDIKRVVVSLILDVLNKEMLLMGASETDDNGRRQLRAMIVVDEAHQFLQRDFNAMEQILRQGRAFGVGMILSTQEIKDFKTKNNDYSGYMAGWVLHHVGSVNKQELVSVFGATDPNIEAYMGYINNAKLFESIAKIGVAQAKSMRDYPYFEFIRNQ